MTIWLVSIYAYFDLPAEVPTHFGFTGRPTSYGNKATFLLLPILFSIAPVIFLLIIRFRFTLINKYPYLVNLPAFFTNINKIEENRRSFWINKYFELTAAVGTGITFFLLYLVLMIYKGSLDGCLPSWFVITVFLLPAAILVPFLFALRSLSKRMKAEIETELL